VEKLGDALIRLRTQVSTLRVATGGSLNADPPADPPPTCPKCKDRGFLRRDVAAGEPGFGEVVVCPCRRREVAERKQNRLERMSNLGPLTRLTFDNLEPEGRTTDPRRRERYARGRAFADAPVGWMLIAGPPGCGKTHLAAAIANFRLAAGDAVIFSVVPDLLDHLRAAFSPNSDMGYDELFESIREAPLLVLDDLGTQSGTPWATEKLFQLLNHRYNGRLPTVITTNLRPDELDERLQTRIMDVTLTNVAIMDDWEASSLERLGGLSLQRLASMTFASFRPDGMGIEDHQRDLMRRVYKRAREFAQEPVGWLVLLGLPGTGKTHIAAAIANDRRAQGGTAYFITAPDLLDYLRSAYAPDSKVSYDKVFEAVRTAPLLVLDDLGAQSGTPWAQEKLFQLLNYRYNAELPTVITSNLTLKEHDPRIESRMLDPRLCDVWPLEVPPYRLDSGDQRGPMPPNRPLRGRPPRGR